MQLSRYKYCRSGIKDEKKNIQKLVDIEDEKGNIPKVSDINSLKMKKNEFASLIFADTMTYRQTLNSSAVKKHLRFLRG